MTELKKLPSDIEENIQNLAGDIYLQIEDKITALLTSYGDNVEVTPEIITQHPLYKELKEQQLSLQQQTENTELKYSEELKKIQAEKAEQQAKLSQLQEDLANAENLNSAKLTDSEQILKDKLAETSRLTKQVAKLSQENAEQQQRLKEIGFESENSNKQLKLLTEEKDSLIKNDKAKAATLAVQNQQYSDLQLKFDQVSSELEYLKAEQEHKLLSSNEQLTHEQQQAEKLKSQISTLQTELSNKQVALDKQQEALSLKTTESKDLSTKVASLEQTISKIEKNSQIAQQQYQDEKQANNTKWVDEKQQIEQALKLASVENEQALKQIHVLERDKQTLEKEIANTNSELSSVNTLQQATLKTVKELQVKIEQEQSTGAKLAAEKLVLEESLVKAEQRFTSDQETHKKKITELTSTLEKDAAENLKLIQSISSLEQKNAAQTKQITSLEQQLENTKREMQQVIEKQDESQSKLIIEHQKAFADKEASISELKLQAEKTAAELAKKITSQAESLKAESEKLAELEASHNLALKAIEQFELSISEKQKQITVLEQELAKTAKSRLWHQENKDKQESEYNKARETIKYLRDENSELNRKLEHQVNELEDKIREYRLRFEYAQKELTKLSN